jgi:Ca2+-binding RTX toxin-like protein
MTSFIAATAIGAQYLISFEYGIVSQTGSVLANYIAISSVGSVRVIVNGDVSSANSYSLYHDGSAMSLTVGSSGNMLAGGYYGVYLASSFQNKVHNAGTIIGNDLGLAMVGTQGDATQELYNSGTIIGGLIGVNISTSSSSAAITNTGTISGQYAGINCTGANSGLFEIHNTGTITGGSAAIYGGEDNGSGTSSDHILNSGLIQGDVYLFSGNDVFDGRGGTVIGIVYGGLGNDTFYVSDGTTTLVEAANEGTDSVFSQGNFILGDNFENITLIGAEQASAFGNALGNQMTGNDNSNWLRGFGGNDVLNGNGGDDVLIGGWGNDSVYGGDDDDRLFGGTGNDILFGGVGRDTLDGGLGADTLYGGADEDTFVYNRIDQSPKTAGYDTIRDFTPNSDAIDLSAFHLTYAAAFSGAAQVITTTNGINTTVWIDADGDSLADMRIFLQGATGLHASDFIL